MFYFNRNGKLQFSKRNEFNGWYNLINCFIFIMELLIQPKWLQFLLYRVKSDSEI